MSENSIPVNRISSQHTLTWEVGFSDVPDAAPTEWVPADVPGAVQLDWGRAKDMPLYYQGDNPKRYRWMEDVYWTYRTHLDFTAIPNDERLFFFCRGIDYRFVVSLDGRVLHEQEGMFTPFEIDLTDQATSGDELTVTVFPAPKSRPEPDNRVQANQCCKPAFSYGWDFHPRLIPLGIWDDTGLETRPADHLRRTEVRYELTPELDGVDVFVDLHISRPGAHRLRWRMTDPDGNVAIDRTEDVTGEWATLTARIESPRLWWPNGQGAPSLYTWSVELLDADGAARDCAKGRTGFRRVRLVMNPGTWFETPLHPMSRAHPPITLEVNDREIFAKGANWTPPHVFPGATTEATYRPLLEMARDAHMNLLRVHGGGPVCKESFYDLCDEYGLMLWQEFPLSCNRYEGTPHYLKILDQESRSIITRLRGHASLVLWCGGNELFNHWSGMTDQDLPLRLLNRNCYDLDPERPFLATSPLAGMSHGNYVFRTAEGKEVFQLFAEAHATAYTEFGVGGPAATVETLRTFIPDDELYPPTPGTAWDTHHAFDAWVAETHLPLKVMEHYFGPHTSLDQILEQGHLLQSEGLKCLYEEARRQKPYTSMALNWCFNEPWPTAANCSIVSWPAEPKPAYYAVADSLRPVLASAKIPRFQWERAKNFTCELWLLNDSPAPVAAGRIEAWLELDGQRELIGEWDVPGIDVNTNLQGPTLRHQLPTTAATRMTLHLHCAEHPQWDSHYVLLVTKL